MKAEWVETVVAVLLTGDGWTVLMAPAGRRDEAGEAFGVDIGEV